jgi:hypothetical protein
MGWPSAAGENTVAGSDGTQPGACRTEKGKRLLGGNLEVMNHIV